MRVTLSVIVFAYNHQAYIETCMDSIFAQKTDFAFEVLLADDHSSDDTVKIVQDKYGDRVRVLERPHNLGYCRNLYEAFREAAGEYIYDCSGDDYLLTDMAFQKHIDFLRHNPQYFSVSNYNKMLNVETGAESIMSCPYTRYSLLDFLQGAPALFYMGTIRNTFKEDDPAYIYRGGKNNEEIQMLYYTLLKGDKAILPEALYMYCYRKQAENYCSTHDYLDILRDYAEGFRAVESADCGQHRFDVARVWYYERYIDRILEAHDIRLAANIFRVLTLREIAAWVWIKFLMKINHHKLPAFLMKKERLCRETAARSGI